MKQLSGVASKLQQAGEKLGHLGNGVRAEIGQQG